MNIASKFEPQSVEAEQQLLGAILLNNDLAHKLGSIITSEHFYDPVHARIFDHCLARIGKGQVASPITLMAEMGSDMGLQELGGGAYLVRMAGYAIASHDIASYAEMIVEMWNRRQVLKVCDEARDKIMSDKPASEAAALMELHIHNQAPTGRPRSMSLLAASTETIRDIIDISEGKSPAIPSGLKSIDEVLSLRRKRYSMLAGTTSMGKTAVGLWLAYSAAKAGYGVGFVSREMPETDLSARMNSIESGIPYKAYDRPMSENSIRKVVDAAKAQESLPIEIFSAEVDDMPAILSEARKLQKKWKPNGDFKGLSMLVIDYIQLIKGEGRKFEVLSEVANELKQVAKLLDVHVLALAQIDRQVMDRDNPRPNLSDLRGSGDLENAPDNVIFCYRDEYFLERKTPPKDASDLADHLADLEASRGKMELITAKARMGELGSVLIGCNMGTNKFWDLPGAQSEVEF